MTKAERDRVAREEGLHLIPPGTRLRKVVDMGYENREQEEDVFHFRVPYYRIRYVEGDSEDMTNMQLNRCIVRSGEDEQQPTSS